MLVKELIEARPKALVSALLVLLASVLFTSAYAWGRDLLLSLNRAPVPETTRAQLTQAYASFDAFAWHDWFRGDGSTLLAVLAAVLGCGLIGGEVSRGTIFFLLSRPVPRARLLAAKYGAGAALLLGLVLLGTGGMLATAALLGRPQPLGGALLSALLLWIGLLSVFGVALLGSVLFADPVRPAGLAILFGLLAGLPGLASAGTGWSLPAYWASRAAYQGQAFPAAEFAVCLVAAAVPAALALALFRRRAY